MSDFGISHLSAYKDIYEPMRDNVFEFLVDFSDTELVKQGTSYLTDSNSIIDSNKAQEVMRFAVNKVDIPSYSQSVIEIKRGNMTMKAAGTMSFDEGSLEIIDYVGADSKSVLMAWQKLSGDPETEQVGRMSNYKKEATLLEYNSDFSQLVRYWKIQGAWISKVSDGGLSNDGGDSKRVMSATVVFDKAILVDGDDIEY